MNHFLYLSLLHPRSAYSKQLAPIIGKHLLSGSAHTHPQSSEELLKALTTEFDAITLFGYGTKSHPQRFRDDLEQCRQTLEQWPQIDIIYRGNNQYPATLEQLDHPPWVIFARGQLPKNDARTLGVIGTRHPNLYGNELIQRILSPFLAEEFGQKVNIVSGGAHGIDTCAHFAALNHQVATTVVLAQDLTKPHSLSDNEVLRWGGCLLSECPPGVNPTKWSFPWRNRIIAGLSQALWVVQGTKKSGTRHTVNQSLDLGRPIGVSPGDVFSELSEIALELLQAGCHVVASPQDLELLLNDMPWV